MITEKSSFILIDFLFMWLVFFSVAFLIIPSWFCIFSVSVIICNEEFFSVVSIWYSVCFLYFMDVFFLYLGKFSSMILLTTWSVV